MALTGLDIYKLLPKENCKECGVPTCLAFAMKVAAGQTSLDECPKITDEARAKLGEASEPPQRLVKMGLDSAPIEIGQETVLFRHDEKFHHPTAIAMKLSDASDAAALEASCEAFGKLQFTRVGQTISPDMIALFNDSGSSDTMSAAAELIHGKLSAPMVLVSEDASALESAAGGALSTARPLLYCTGEPDADKLADLAEKTKCPICVAGQIQSVADTVEALAAKGVKDVVISPGPVGSHQSLEFLTQTRRAALTKKFRPLGCPVLTIACDEDESSAALDACIYVAKYAGIVISSAWQGYNIATILTTRQNIYTDPQKPVQVEPKIYEIGQVTETSPLIVTTNFSLTYYAVEAEAEASRVPCRILAVDTEGTSVLTAWAADKFNAETITAALKSSGAEEKVKDKQLILPGLVAVLSAQVADESKWQVKVGPKDASGLGPYLNTEWQAA